MQLQKLLSFTNCITEVNNTAVIDDFHFIDILMSINNLREYTSAYPKTLGPLWRYYRDKPALKNNSNITDFPANHNNSISLKFK